MTTAVSPKNGQASVEGAAPAPVQGLHEKIALITAKAQELVTATGQTQQGKDAFSIGDVEQVVGKLCAESMVTTRWSTVELTSYDQPTKDGSMRMWIVHLRCKVTNAELVDESFEDEWIDIGTNPAAGASFCRKGYFKALFHLAEKNDEAKGEAPATGGGSPATARASIPQQSSTGAKQRPDKTPTGRSCPSCGTGDLMVVAWPGKAPSHIECSDWKNCKYREPFTNRDLRTVAGAGDQVPLEAYDQSEVPF